MIITSKKKTTKKKTYKKKLKWEMMKTFKQFISDTSSSSSEHDENSLADDMLKQTEKKKIKKKEVGKGFQDLNYHYNILNKFDGLFLNKEFDELVQIDMSLNRKKDYFKTSKLFPNYNRFKGILANENTKIELNDGDYINANYVDGNDFNIPQSFIATQAPLPNTINQFWNMIWEKGSLMIVMFQEIENTPVTSNITKYQIFYDNENKETEKVDMSKVDFSTIFKTRTVFRYWPNPNEIIKRGNNLTIIGLADNKETDTEGIFMRKFKIIKNKGEETEESRILTMYQYTKWPDMSVPRDPKSFLELVNKVYNNYFNGDQKKGPITLHCIAGVGRTGTFACVSIIVTQMKKFLEEREKKGKGFDKFTFNIYDVVKKLKNKRKGMVQKIEQYKFCYEVIHEEAQNLGII